TINPNYSYTYGDNTRSTIGPRQTVNQQWNAAGHRTRYSDSLLTALIRPDGNGNIEEVTRQEDGATYVDSSSYDNIDHLQTASDSFGPVATYIARADGKNLQVSNPRNNSTHMEHSAMGELLLRHRADGMEYRARHDEQRQMKYTGDAANGIAFD